MFQNEALTAHTIVYTEKVYHFILIGTCLRNILSSETNFITTDNFVTRSKISTITDFVLSRWHLQNGKSHFIKIREACSLNKVVFIVTQK